MPQNPQADKQALERQAIEQLRKVIGRAGAGEDIIQGSDITLPDETPGQANRRLYGTPANYGKDVNLSLPDPQPRGSMSALMDMITGLFSGPKERPMTPEELAAPVYSSPPPRSAYERR